RRGGERSAPRETGRARAGPRRSRHARGLAFARHRRRGARLGRLGSRFRRIEAGEHEFDVVEHVAEQPRRQAFVARDADAEGGHLVADREVANRFAGQIEVRCQQFADVRRLLAVDAPDVERTVDEVAVWFGSGGKRCARRSGAVVRRRGASTVRALRGSGRRCRVFFGLVVVLVVRGRRGAAAEAIVLELLIGEPRGPDLPEILVGRCRQLGRDRLGFLLLAPTSASLPAFGLVFAELGLVAVAGVVLRVAFALDLGVRRFGRRLAGGERRRRPGVVRLGEVLELDLFLQRVDHPTPTSLEGEVVELVDLAELVTDDLEFGFVDVDDDLILGDLRRGSGFHPRPSALTTATATATAALRFFRCAFGRGFVGRARGDVVVALVVVLLVFGRVVLGRFSGLQRGPLGIAAAFPTTATATATTALVEARAIIHGLPLEVGRLGGRHELGRFRLDGFAAIDGDGRFGCGEWRHGRRGRFGPRRVVGRLGVGFGADRFAVLEGLGPAFP